MVDLSVYVSSLNLLLQMRILHRLSDINEGALSARCLVCGPVSIRRKGVGRDGRRRWACKVAEHAQDEKTRKRPSYRKYQREYQREYARALAVDNPDAVHGWTRDTQLRRYGLTQALYNQMVLDRGGRCDLCQDIPTPSKGRRYALYVDHDHVSGRVRGLLCQRCNLALGLLRDRPEVAARVGKYLGGNLR